MTGSRHRLSVLNFHGIGMPHAGVPDSEKPYWLSNERFLKILDHVAVRRRRGADIRITFDDGNLSDLDAAVPALQRVGLVAEFFVLTGRLKTASYLNPSAVRALQDMGMAIGLHGHSHQDWRTLDRSGLDTEIVSARAKLEDIIGNRVISVAVPFGAYNRRVIARLKGEPFEAIYTSDGGQTDGAARIRARTTIRADTTMEQIDAVLDGTEQVSVRFRRTVSMLLKQHLI